MPDTTTGSISTTKSEFLKLHREIYIEELDKLDNDKVASIMSDPQGPDALQFNLIVTNKVEARMIQIGA
jgi:hypothetical protein